MANINYADGTVCWIDLGTTDPEATQDFYSTLFGWTIEYVDPSGYRLCAFQGDLVAAIGTAEDPGLPYWSTNISVSNIVETTKDFAAAGAEIVLAPRSAGPPGDYSVIRDPAGAPVSLWQAGTHSGMQRTGEPGTFAGITLLTDKIDRVRQFYEVTLGWEFDSDAELVRLRGQVVARLNSCPPPQAPPYSLWLVSFVVDDLPSAVRDAGQLGATGIELDLGGGCAIMRDPAGALFGLALPPFAEGA